MTHDTQSTVANGEYDIPGVKTLPPGQPPTQPLIGDVVSTAEVTFDSPVERDHDIVFNSTIADQPWGAACVKLEGPRTFTAAQLRRAAIRFQQMADVAEGWRAAKGFDE